MNILPKHTAKQMARKLHKLGTQVFKLLIIFVFSFTSFLYPLPLINNVKPVMAEARTISTQADWQAGKYEFNEIDTITNAGSIQLQADLGTWDGQESPAYFDHYVGAGGATANTKILKVGRYVYAFRNRAIGQFMRYDLDTREWKEMAYLPNQAYEVIDATSDGISTIYAFATRTNRKHFLKYDIPTNTWEYLSTTPLGLGIGATLEYVSGSTNYVYAMQGGGTGFWRFNTNPAVYSWSSQLTTTATCGNYCDLHYDGSQYLYLASNNYNPDRFLRLDTTLANPTWSTVANFPLDTSVNYGSDLVQVGADFYMMRTGTAHPGSQTLYKYTGGSWTSATDVPFFTAYGSMTYDSDNNRIVVLGGIGEMAFYYPATNTWSNQSLGPPSNAYQTGTTLTADASNNIYMCRGQSTNSCYYYSTSDNTWTTLPTTGAPTLGAAGSSLSFTNGYLYAFRGSSSSQIGHYTPGSPGSWGSNLSPTNAVTLAEGSSVVASDSASIFVAVGNSVNFRKYTISTNTYSTLANLPENAYRGSGLVAGDDGGIRYIYALLSGNRGKFYRYHETTNGWHELASLPVGSYYGAGLAYDSANGYIYATVGGENQVWSRRLYRYSIADNSWMRMADAPAMIRNGGGITYANNALYVYQGYGGSFWKYTPSTTTYKTSGTWYSPVYDNTHVSSWGSFSVSDSGSGITYYTRTSQNNNMWDDWVEVSGSTIGSETYRYIQVKAVLTGAGNSSPTISSITVNYNGDTSGPDMTSFSVTGYVEKGSSTTLVSGNSYSYTNPYFSWTGASESETLVAGYYVYWGTEDADPVLHGNYQTTSNYVVNTAMVNGSIYKLRIVSKNTAGVTSDPVTFFTYEYAGISPASSITVASAQDEWDATGSAKNNTYASGSNWWDSKYMYRQKLTVTVSSDVKPGTMAEVAIDTDDLESEGKVRSDRNDWRIVYYNGLFWKELSRNYVNATSTYFPLQKGINSGGSDNNYYVYYGHNYEEITPSSLIEYSYSNAKWGTSLSFDGSNDYVQIPTVINNLSQMTIEGWFKYNNPAANRWFYGNNSTTQTAVGTIANSHYATYSLRIGSTTYANNGTTWLESGKWYHFALTYDGTTGTAQGFINGRLDFTRTGLSGNISVTQAQYLGRSNTQYYYGYLDDVRISDTVRYTNGFTPLTEPFTTDANTLSLYHFDDRTDQTLTDSSGNNNHGTLGSTTGSDTNDPTWTYSTVATAGSEENTPESADDTSLTLEPMNEGSWAGHQLPSRPFGAQAGYGASIVIDDELYSIRGANTVGFFKLNLSTGTWTQLADIPANAYYGASMVHDGSGAIYASRGNNSSSFYKYTIATNTWTDSIDQPSYNFSYGAVMTKVDQKIYILRGGNANVFLSFDPRYESTSDGIDAWSTLQTAPYNAYSGSGLANDQEGNLWYVAGNGSNFAKYNIGNDTWDTTITAPATIPYIIGYSSHNALFHNGYIYTFTTYDHQGNNETKNRIWRYLISADKWENIQTTDDFWMSTGQVAYDGSRYVYLSNGYQGSSLGNNTIARYDLTTNTIFPDTPIMPLTKLFTADNELVYNQMYNYSNIVYDENNSIYVMRGANSNTPVNNWFNKYSLMDKNWSMLPNPPCYTAGGMAYAKGKLYLICSGNTRKFYSYDPAMAEWTNLPDTPDTVNASGAQIIAHDGGNDLYVVRGANSQTLYKYTIGGSWTTESSSIPVSIGTGRGVSITSDGADYLYITRGNATADFYRYKFTDAKGWTILTSIPENVSWGSGSVLYNGKIYLSTGYMNSGMYIYDIALGVWQNAPNTPSATYAGSAMTKGPDESIFMLQGYYYFTIWKYNVPSATTSYKFSGTYTSRVVDLGSPYMFAGLEANISSPSATSVYFETRTSTDSAHWDDWVETSDLKQNPSNKYIYHINSALKKYIQVKVSMTSDQSYQSPLLSDISLLMYADSDPPTNPDNLNAYHTATKSAELVDNTWYNKSSPYFEWSGSDDGTGSGLAGYYVYFGTNEDADASISGVLRSQANYTASLATNGNDDGEYYLKIKAVDNAGNINPDHWSPFHYRYDRTPPSELDANYIVVSPDKSSNINNYTFYWDQSASEDPLSNATASGLLGYYYKTGTASGALSQDQLTTNMTVGSITAYREGDNTFYLRAEDIAGNTTTVKTKTYKYNSTAPSEPRNLAVDTSRASANYFSFTWDEPATYRGTIDHYRYSINQFPLTDNNISTTSARIVNNIRGTQDGINTFYIVAVDDAGNVSYDNYTSMNFSVSVTAPGIPLNPEAFDNSIRATETYRVGLTWDAPSEKGSSFDRYDIYASTDETECSTDMSGYTLAGSTAGTSYVVTAIGEDDLESTTYYFCVKACATTNQCSSPSTTISMQPTGRWLSPPDLTASPSATVRTKTATIRWTTSRTCNSFVKYGVDSVESSEVGSSAHVTSHEVDLTGLNPDTTYKYKVLSTDEDGNTLTSNEYTFTTNPAPSISKVTVSDISLYSAFVTFTVKNANEVRVLYGKSLSYGGVETLSTSINESTHTVKLEGLEDDTEYNLMIVAEDEENNEFESDNYVFSTLPKPEIVSVTMQQVIDEPTATVRILWTSNTEISSIVTYYPTALPAQARDMISLTHKIYHEAIIPDLADEVEYTFLIRGRDIAGNEAVAEPLVIKTTADLRAPEIIDMTVESTILGVGDQARAQIIVCWDTDERATTQVEYGQGTSENYSSSTKEDTNLTSNHCVTIPNVKPSEIYQVSAVSKDKAGNVGRSAGTVIVTPSATKNALSLVIEKFATTFGFIKNINFRR